MTSRNIFRIPRHLENGRNSFLQHTCLIGRIAINRKGNNMMKRTILIVLLQISAYICFAQEIIGGDNIHVGDEYGNGVPDAIVHLAKSIWLHFPKADKVHYNYKRRRSKIRRTGLQYLTMTSLSSPKDLKCFLLLKQLKRL